jgi:O-succinylbenzoate synthase
MKHAKESSSFSTFKRRAGRMLDLIMRTTVKVDFGNKDLGMFIDNTNENIPIGFLKFDDKVWTSNEVHMFAKYINSSTEFRVSCLYFEPEPVTITT